METSIPPSQDNLDQGVKRQVTPRPEPVKWPRERRWGRIFFLIFIAFFLLVVILMILDLI